MRRRSCVTMAWPVVLALATGAADAQDDVRRYFRAEFEDRHRLAITACDDPGIWHECVIAELSCDVGEPRGGHLMLSTERAEALVRNIMSAATGFPSMLFELGPVSVRVQFLSFDVSVDEMNGGWIVTMDAWDMDHLFRVLALTPADDFRVTVGGEVFQLSPTAEGDWPLIASVAAACSGT